jgi:hypothetical protein
MPFTYRDDRFNAHGDDGRVYQVHVRHTVQRDSFIGGDTLEVEVERTILANGQLVEEDDDGRMVIKSSGVVIRRMK